MCLLARLFSEPRSDERPRRGDVRLLDEEKYAESRGSVMSLWTMWLTRMDCAGGGACPLAVPFGADMMAEVSRLRGARESNGYQRGPAHDM